MSLLSALPKGDALAEPDWPTVIGEFFPFYGSMRWESLYSASTWGAGPTLYLAGGALPAFIAIAAQLPVVRRRHQAVIDTYRPMTASALLVHFARGQTELHFHFF